MSKELKTGDKVKVMRQIGPNGTPAEVTGELVKFMNRVRIGGEKTALIKYDDNGEEYPHPLSKILLIKGE